MAVLIPGLAIFICVYAFNMLGDALRDVLITSRAGVDSRRPRTRPRSVRTLTAACADVTIGSEVAIRKRLHSSAIVILFAITAAAACDEGMGEPACLEPTRIAVPDGGPHGPGATDGDPPGMTNDLQGRPTRHTA
jgi:hypothetical protein